MTYPVGTGSARRRVPQANSRTQGIVRGPQAGTALRVVGGSRGTDASHLADDVGGALILPIGRGRRVPVPRTTASFQARQSRSREVQASITPIYGLVERVAPIHPLVQPARPEDPEVAREREIARRVAARKAARLRRMHQRRIRAVSAVVTSIAVLSAAWLASSALRGLHAQPYRVLAGSVKIAQGYRYTVQSGDSIWSIATRLEPSGDPRPLADEIQAALGNSTLQPGMHIVLP